MSPHMRISMEKRFPGITERELFIYTHVLEYSDRVKFLKARELPTKGPAAGVMKDLDALLAHERDKMRMKVHDRLLRLPAEVEEAKKRVASELLPGGLKERVLEVGMGTGCEEDG